jgi:hypothetical protein
VRVRFNNSIYLCGKATHRKGSPLILFTTYNNVNVYTVDIKDGHIADKIYQDVLMYGYCDVSDYEYSN